MRVITGSARGVRLQAPKGTDTRPTLDQVKEGIFSAIQFEVEGRRVLDLFAGSGQMGIEPRRAACGVRRYAQRGMYGHQGQSRKNAPACARADRPLGLSELSDTLPRAVRSHFPRPAL